MSETAVGAAAPLIELRDVALGPAQARVVEGLSFTLRAGRTAVIVGGAGSGKSTVIKLAAAVLVPDQGDVLVEGKSFGAFTRREQQAFRARMGFIFDDDALWANMSIRDNVAFPFRLHRPAAAPAEVARAVDRALELVNWTRRGDPRPAELSRGERTRIAIARALVLDPELLFVDDVAADLGWRERERFDTLLASYRERGRTLVITTGEAAVAARVGDDVGAIAEGRLLAWGTYEDAERWDAPEVGAVLGRLPPRRRTSGLVASWEDSLAGDDGGRTGG